MAEHSYDIIFTRNVDAPEARHPWAPFLLPVLLITSAAAGPVEGLAANSGSCNSPAGFEERRYLASLQDPALGSYSLALDYLSLGCATEAQQAFQATIEALQREPQLPTKRLELLGLARAGLEVARGEELLTRGDKNSASSLFRQVFQRYERSVISLHAVLALSRILPSDSPEWAQIEEHLEELGELGHWQARRALTSRLLDSKRASIATADLERFVNRAPSIHDSYAGRVLLAEAYLTTGRVLDAWLLVRTIDRQGGDEIVDPQLRVAFLEIAQRVALARIGQRDTEPDRFAESYSRALRTVGNR